MTVLHWMERNIHTTALTPRDYQTELLSMAREENLIVCLAHNSAKEFLAVKLIQSLRSDRDEPGKDGAVAAGSPRRPRKTVFLTERTDRVVLASMVANLTDLTVSTVANDDEPGSSRQDLAGSDVLFMSSAAVLLELLDQAEVLQVEQIRLLIVDECHKTYGHSELWEVCGRIERRNGARTKIVGLAGPLHGASCTPERLCWELRCLERCLRARIETASDITSILRFSTKPTELILECTPARASPLARHLRALILRQIAFLQDHRYDPLAMYGMDANESDDLPVGNGETDGEKENDEENEFRRELRSIPDPKAAPLRYLHQYLELLDEFGPWGADRGALDLLTTIEKEKIRTPYERHFLLLCMVSTVLVQARSMAAGVFSRYTTEMERIRRYSTPKVRRLLEVLAWFGEQQARPNDQHTSNASTTLQQQQLQQTMYCFCRTAECKELGREYHTFGSRIGDVGERIDRLAKQLHTVRHATDRLMLKHRNRDGGSSEINSGSSPRHHGTAQPHTDGRPGNLRRRRCGPGIGGGGGGGPPWLNGATGHHQRGHDSSGAGATEALCGLIFCNDRSIARILYVLLYEVARSQPEFAFLSAQYTVDKVVDPLTDAQHAALEHRKQEEVLKRFRMHDCNLLIGTSVLEEGIELPKCNLVIRWSQPSNYRSYAQCKGRAKAPGAYHILFVTPDIGSADDKSLKHDQPLDEPIQVDVDTTGGDGVLDRTVGSVDPADRELIDRSTDAMVERVAIYREVEKLLLSKCRNGEPEDGELKHADCFNHCLEIFRAAPSPDQSPPANAATSLGLSNAVQTLNKYCAKLPSDTFTKLTPIWRCATTVRNDRTLYQYTIRLPINSPWKEDILGLPMPTETLARRMAAYIACRMLHAAGELDHSFQPFGKEAFRAFEADWENFELDELDAKILSENNDPRPGTTKRRQYYYKRIASVFNDCRPEVGTTAYLYYMRMELICPIPEEQNTRGRKIYAPEESPQGFGILTTKLIPKISSFPIFTRSGEVKVSLDLCPERVQLTERQLSMVNCFVRYTFTKVLRLQKSLMLYDANATENCFFIVPTIRQPTDDGGDVQVDWEFVEKIALNVDRSGPTFIPDEARKGYQFDVNRFRDAVVMPWYRNRDQPQYFYVAEICHHLSPKSAFPGSNYATFEEYYHRKYDIQIQNVRQPLLDVDHTSARLNFLTPRYVNRKGVALPTSSEETKRAKRENLEQKQILVPELCTIHPFPASLWRAAVCLPCVLYRINALLLADEIRRQVARDLKLGREDLDQLHGGKFEWPMLSFGWNLADVLRKTKEQKVAQAAAAAAAVIIATAEPAAEEGTGIDASLKEGNETESTSEETEKKAIESNPHDETGETTAANQEEKNPDDGSNVENTPNENGQSEEEALLEIGTWSNEMAVGVDTGEDGESGIGGGKGAFLRYDSDCASNSSGNYYSSDEYDEEEDGYLYDDSGGGASDEESALPAITAAAGESGTEPGALCEANGSGKSAPVAPETTVSTVRRLKIEFKSETMAEAIDSERDLQRQRTQQSIIQRSRQNERLYQITKNAAEGFSCSLALATMMDANERVEAEQRFAEQKNHTKDAIRLHGTLVRWNESLTVDHWRSRLEANERATLTALMDDMGGRAFIEFVPYIEEQELFTLLIQNGSTGERWLRLHDLYQLNARFFPEQYTILRGGSHFDHFLDEDDEQDRDGYAVGGESSTKVITLTIRDPFPAIAAGQTACNYKVSQDPVTDIAKQCNGVLEERLEQQQQQQQQQQNDETASITFNFDEQPDLEQHPGPSPAIILQALTMSNANDGINLERLETIGDSFLKYAITTYLYCRYDNVHEGKLSHLRSKQVSNLNLYRLGRRKRLGDCMIAAKFEPHDNWLPPCYYVPKELEQTLIDAKIPACHWNLADLPDIKRLSCAEICQLVKERARTKRREELERRNLLTHTNPGVQGVNGQADINADDGDEEEDDDDEDEDDDDDDDDDDDNDDDDDDECNEGGSDFFSCFIPYNLVTQHSIPDKSVADCVEALIGAYLIECGPRGALLFMAWLGIRVLPIRSNSHVPKSTNTQGTQELVPYGGGGTVDITEYGHWIAPPSPMVRANITFGGLETGASATARELNRLLEGFEVFERSLGYHFQDRSYLLQAMTHASYSPNRLTDCYQRLEFLGDAILDYLITRHLYEDRRQHSPGALTDLRSALVNNTIFAALAVRHGFHRYFLHLSPGLQEVIDRFVRIQQENGHRITEEEYYLPDEDDDVLAADGGGFGGGYGEIEGGQALMGSGEAEDVEVPKALGDVFESIAGAIFLDSGMSLNTVWKVYRKMMGPEIEKFSSSVPKSPIRELLEMEPETAKFGKPEKLADGRRVRVTVEVFGKGTFRGIGRNYRIAKCTAAKCALRQLKKLGYSSHHKRR